ncbi:MAG: phytanoyl-CoA dioxygenase family protein [Spirochaetaceae bacterium]|nr:phytanoyl-CoA dioxygenase family protein [Myxococcales bacterium]MCB9725474.1 phytanoyl-CoA dioxygenase family protein [Spirochaetaceae bacterium]HPG24832.1 phytanoyl-CoA dioxygenase family protein [Myxococcota bacterium]
MGEIRTLSTSELDAYAAAIEERGYVVAENVIPRSTVESLTATIDRLLVDLDVPFGDNAFLGRHTRRIFNLLARDPVFRSIPIHPGTLPVIERVLDDQCLLSSLTAAEMNPGQEAQALHSDDASHRLQRPGPPSVAVAIWALTDFTRENGGTRLVPGSHRFDRPPRRGDDPETVSIEMSAGSVLLYNASLWHGGGANRSSARRIAIVCNYCAGYLRQEECQLLAIPRAQVEEFEPRLRRLIGYSTYRGLLGHIDGESPESLIDPTIETDMVWRRIGR